ncbi:hypothetical protein B0H19DRAFT_1069386 [Mycena capillaripes]|nr:hypothetical protein B0H19DRAFT_1069386 [Mycena capillaripes]
MAQAPMPTPSIVPRSPKFWKEDGSVHFQVEVVLYKVPVIYFKSLSTERMLVNLLRVELWEISEAVVEDIERMGVTAYSIIARAKETLWSETRLACGVLPALDPHLAWVYDAHNHRICTEVFKEVWWTNIAKKVIDPTKPLRLCDMAAKIRTIPFQVQR